MNAITPGGSTAAAQATDALHVSVALCTHNGARFLEAQLRSILEQTLPPREVVVSDDASSDGSADLAEQWFATWHRDHPDVATSLRVLRNPTALGVRANFEQAVRACSGEYIALCDQDDLWQPHRLSTMTGILRARPELLLLHTDARLVDASGQPLGRTLFQSLEVTASELQRIHAGAALGVLLRASRVTGATTVFRRRLLDFAVPFPPVWWHDEWLAIIAASVGTIDVLEQQLIDYRQHGANVLGAPVKTSLAENVNTALARDGNARRQHLALRAEILQERLIAAGTAVPAQCLQAVHAYVEHHRLRANLPARRIQRVLPIVRELFARRYGRFSSGLRSVLRDLFVSA